MEKVLEFIDKLAEVVVTIFKYSIPCVVGAILAIIIVFFSFGFSGSFTQILTQILLSGIAGSLILIFLTYRFPKTLGALFGIFTEVEISQE